MPEDSLGSDRRGAYDVGSFSNPDASVEELRELIRAGVVLTDPALTRSYGADNARLVPGGTPAGVVVAQDENDVVAAMRWAQRHRVPVVPRGAGTGLSGAAAAPDGCLVISLANMSRILGVDESEQIATVEPGVSAAELDRAVAGMGLFYAPDPSSFDISTLGGNVATNAGGLRCLRYGVTQDALTALRVVLPSGEILDTGHRTRKGVAGLDLTSLFCGSEGTLGVMTELTFRLLKRPQQHPWTLFASFRSVFDAANACLQLTGLPSTATLLEIMDYVTLAAIDEWKNTGLTSEGPAAVLLAQWHEDLNEQRRAEIVEACQTMGSVEAQIAYDAEESDLLIGLRRLALPALNRLGVTLLEDVSVPRRHMAELLTGIQVIAKEQDLIIGTFGHAGDGNMHPTIVIPDSAPQSLEAAERAAASIFSLALRLDGTISGEHGVGLLKLPWLDDDIGELARGICQQIKRVFDPLGVLNPGKAY